MGEHKEVPKESFEGGGGNIRRYLRNLFFVGVGKIVENDLETQLRPYGVSRSIHGASKGITPMRVPREPGLRHPPPKTRQTKQEHRDTKSGLWVSKGSLERDAKSSLRDHRDNNDTRKQEHKTIQEHGEPTMRDIQ